jgi:hypothetical protein
MDEAPCYENPSGADETRNMMAGTGSSDAGRRHAARMRAEKGRTAKRTTTRGEVGSLVGLACFTD